MIVRRATLDDARRIVKLHIDAIPLWQRLDDRGRVQDLPYDALSIYERWLHGGAWMTLETAAIWLNHLLSGGGLAWVVDDEGTLVAYAEAFVNNELLPMARHLHLAGLRCADSAGLEAHQLLADAILDDAREASQLSVAYPEYDAETANYYRTRFGVSEAFRLRGYTLSAQISQSFYKVQAYDRMGADLIDGWAMPIGRTSSPRHMWESEWQALWNGIPQIASRGKHRLYINAAGHEALLCFQQQLYKTRHADVYCWSPRHLSAPLLVAVRDQGHRLGFRWLTLALPESAAKLLPGDAVADPNEQVIATAGL